MSLLLPQPVRTLAGCPAPASCFDPAAVCPACGLLLGLLLLLLRLGRCSCSLLLLLLLFRRLLCRHLLYCRLLLACCAGFLGAWHHSHQGFGLLCTLLLSLLLLLLLLLLLCTWHDSCCRSNSSWHSSSSRCWLLLQHSQQLSALCRRWGRGLHWCCCYCCCRRLLLLDLEQHHVPVLLAQPARMLWQGCSFVTWQAEIHRQMQQEVLVRRHWDALVLSTFGGRSASSAEPCSCW